MTLFTRTPSGQNNQALFYGVDRVVYVEGDGDDQAFWEEIFRVFSNNGFRYKFKSVGSRSTVEEYAELIIKNQSGNCIAIIDSDYEALKSSLINWPNVIYTYGYSYENDLFGMRQALRILSQLSGNRLTLASIRTFVGIMRRLSVLLLRITKLDLRANICGNSFLPKNGKSCRLSVTGNQHFPICRKSMAALVRAFKSAGLPLSAVGMPAALSLAADGLRWTYGHLIKSAVCTILGKIWKTLFRGALPNDVIESVAIASIRNFGQSFFPPAQRYYYVDLLSRIR